MGEIKIYQTEIDDGLTSKLGGSNSAKINASLLGIGSENGIDRFNKACGLMDAARISLSSHCFGDADGVDQKDLAVIVSILVSTGWNLNDDVFISSETYAARATPLHKPINMEHKGTDIIGHIFHSRAVDKDGVPIDDAEIPENFDIEVAGVLYKSLPEIKERIEKVISGAADGTMFVSMEAFFDDFAYAVQDVDSGKITIVERNKDTAFLTKHLRIYGGTGVYDDKKIGRVLLDITFAGKGIVAVPANPESVIKEVASTKVEPMLCCGSKMLGNLPKGGVTMDKTEKLEAKNEELSIQLGEIQAKLQASEDKVVQLAKENSDIQKSSAGLETKVDALTKDVDDAGNKCESLSKEAEENFNKAIKRAEDAEAKLADVEATETAKDRLEKLSAVRDIPEDEREGTLSELKGMNDATFATVLKYAGGKGSTEEGADADTATAALDAAKVVLENTPDMTSGGSTESETQEQEYAAMASFLVGDADEDEEE